MANKRLFKEYRGAPGAPPAQPPPHRPPEMQASAAEGILAGPKTDDDIFEWDVLIAGPPGTPFEGGLYAAELKFPRNYPHAPPKMCAPPPPRPPAARR